MNADLAFYRGVRALGTRHIADVCGTWIHWCERGQGRPTILLHGLGDSHQTWREVAGDLADSGRRVLMVDLPGHGLSARPDASYSIGWHAAIIGAWLDDLAFEEFDLVGHSYGGGVALYLLLTHRQRVGAIGLVAAGGLGREVSLGVRLLSLPGIDRLVQPCLQLGTRAFLRATPRAFLDRGDRHWHAWANAAPGTGRAMSRTVRDVVGLRGQRQSLYDRLDEIDNLPPIALFWGERDPIIPAAHGRRAAERLGGAPFHTFEACGHFPHLECPGAFASELTEFLESARPVPVALEVVEPAPARPSWPRRIVQAVVRWFRGRRQRRAKRRSRASSQKLLRAPSQGDE